MSRLTSQYPERVYSASEEERNRGLMERMSTKSKGRGWMIGGLVVLGLGALAWYKFGPDFVRYMKMERM